MREGRATRWSLFCTWAVPAVLAIYGVVLIVRFRDLAQHNALNADVVSAPVIGELVHGAPHGADKLLGNYPWYETLWFERLTHGLPAHRAIWEAFPYGMALLAILLTVWSVRRVAGGAAALLAAVPLFCASVPLISFSFQGTTHSPTAAHVALLGAGLVWLATRPPPLTWPTVAGFVALVGVLTAIGTASDELIYPAGIVPFAGAGLVLWWLRREAGGWRALYAVAGVLLVGVLGGALLDHVMKNDGYRFQSLNLHFAGDAQLWTNGRLAIESAAYLGNGDFWGRPFHARAVVALICAAILAAAARAIVRALRASSLGWRETIADQGRTTFLVFWTLCLVGTVAAFVLSTAPVDILSSRYLLPAWYASAALLPLAVLRSPIAWRAAVVGVCVIGLTSAALLAKGEATDNLAHWPDSGMQKQLETALAPLHVDHGYAGYWDAAAITWGTHTRLKTYPVYQCVPSTNTLCRFYFHNISSWYGPAKPGVRTFVIVDPAQPFVKDTDPALGRPLRTLTVDRLKVFVYNYDVASKIHP